MASGNESAQRRFYNVVWPQAAALLRTARILTGNDAEADDLVQETMLKAFKAIDAFHDGTNAKAWLMTILRNTRVDRLRSEGTSNRHVSLDDIGTTELVASAAQDAAEREAAWRNPAELLNALSDQQIIDALHQLPGTIRWTLLLTDIEGINHQDAAVILKIPVGTVKSRIHRGHAMLKELLLPLAKDIRLVRQ